MLMTTFATLVNQKILIPSSRTNYVAVEKSHLNDFMKPLLRMIHVDADWYIRTNPDVAQAIFDGVITTASDHYVTFGYYEHRMPYRIEVDADWYLAHTPTSRTRWRAAPSSPRRSITTSPGTRRAGCPARTSR